VSLQTTSDFHPDTKGIFTLLLQTTQPKSPQSPRCTLTTRKDVEEALEAVYSSAMGEPCACQLAISLRQRQQRCHKCGLDSACQLVQNPLLAADQCCQVTDGDGRSTAFMQVLPTPESSRQSPAEADPAEIADGGSRAEAADDPPANGSRRRSRHAVSGSAGGGRKRRRKGDAADDSDGAGTKWVGRRKPS